MSRITNNYLITKEDLDELKADLIKELLYIIDVDLKKRYMTKKEVCEYLRISNNTLDKWILVGLPVLRINGIIRFDRVAIDKWLEKRV